MAHSHSHTQVHHASSFSFLFYSFILFYLFLFFLLPRILQSNASTYYSAFIILFVLMSHSRLPSWSSNTASGLRQRFSLTTIVVSSVIGITLVLLLLSSMAHFYQSPTDWNRRPTTTREKSLDTVPENHRQLLVLLPQDKNRQEGNYGFKEAWLEKAIENRKSYADAHGAFFFHPTHPPPSRPTLLPSFGRQ